MSGRDSEDAPHGTASPSCSLERPDACRQPFDIAHWRKTERPRLIAARMALSGQERREYAQRIAKELDALLMLGRETCVSVYWPFRGEPNLTPWMSAVASAGIRVALPVVIAKGQPLEFREWQPGAPLAKGVWNIPYPADSGPVVPTVVVAPLVGFDCAGFRLGYGGGFFDRTLAALPSKPLAIGVGYLHLEIPTIHPQPHDIPMDWIVTGNGAPRDMRSARHRDSKASE